MEGASETPVEHKGIKETEEALKAVLLVSVFLVKRLKDGVDLSDAVAVVQKVTQDPEFKDAMVAAVAGYNQIPNELKDLDLNESVALLVQGTKGVKDIIVELRS